MKPQLRPRRGAHRGFTLIEVLVALLIMAILAALSWQGLDGILRARDSNRDAIDRTVRLATVLTQWEQDLQAVFDPGVGVRPLAFDGQTLRLTRRTEGGVMLVTWALRNGVWQRWTSPALVRGAALQDAWSRSQAFQGQEAGQLTVATGAGPWQVYFNWGGQWSNAQSTGNQEAVAEAAAVAPPPASPASAAPPAGGASSVPPALPNAAAAAAAAAASAARPVTRTALPDAVRLQITLDGRQLTRDVVVGGGS